MNQTYTYTYSKSTKGTHVFTNPDLGVYYLPRTIFAEDPKAGSTIQVTIAQGN